MTASVRGTPSPLRHSQGGTGLGWLESPRLAALASDSSRSSSRSAGVYF